MGNGLIKEASGYALVSLGFNLCNGWIGPMIVKNTSMGVKKRKGKMHSQWSISFWGGFKIWILKKPYTNFWKFLEIKDYILKGFA